MIIFVAIKADSIVCVRIGNQVSEWFSVKVEVRQGCVMSPWLLNLYMDGVVREVQARALGTGTQLIREGKKKWK